VRVHAAHDRELITVLHSKEVIHVTHES
jgi:hypothetical protein